MKSNLVAFLCALLFALGLGISGMTNPANIIGFLDIGGEWKPALLLVMGGAVSVYSLVYFLVVARLKHPKFASQFLIPSKRTIDWRLIVGSLLFGIGWGIGGYCPGPALVSLVTMSSSILLFVGSMCVGIALYHYIFSPIFLKERS